MNYGRVLISAAFFRRHCCCCCCCGWVCQIMKCSGSGDLLNTNNGVRASKCLIKSNQHCSKWVQFCANENLLNAHRAQCIKKQHDDIDSGMCVCAFQAFFQPFSLLSLEQCKSFRVSFSVCEVYNFYLRESSRWKQWAMNPQDEWMWYR